MCSKQHSFIAQLSSRLQEVYFFASKLCFCVSPVSTKTEQHTETINTKIDRGNTVQLENDSFTHTQTRTHTHLQYVSLFFPKMLGNLSTQGSPWFNPIKPPLKLRNSNNPGQSMQAKLILTGCPKLRRQFITNWSLWSIWLPDFIATESTPTTRTKAWTSQKIKTIINKRAADCGGK